eukprot:CAMPEP_0115835338 /NCGR_PEP_ID=MMETSP0287-20121206/4143_1 /TAXON_ID=412157 /ORGANISM="Chrysochromulina rotalis, Strain UIO044" /LENGTH=69 /DNA_ID=CAMNT_0003288793 /DNA_START=424 /DNA_END=629 /DNA_ORIENTATION=-
MWQTPLCKLQHCACTHSRVQAHVLAEEGLSEELHHFGLLLVWDCGHATLGRLRKSAESSELLTRPPAPP